MTDSASTVRVVVLGAGFGGLELCKRLRHENVEITLVDRQNHHLFQPLLYQIATSGLSVLLQWVWAYLHYKPGARIILKTETRHEGECPPLIGSLITRVAEYSITGVLERCAHNRSSLHHSLIAPAQ